MLNITLDNASNNDAMVDELRFLVENWPGPANRSRCFLHVVNLVAKALLRQFDPPKKDAEAALTAAEKELMALSDELDDEDEEDVGANDANDADDDLDGWVDELEAMEEEERDQLLEEVQPVRLALAKVRNCIIRSDDFNSQCAAA